MEVQWSDLLPRQNRRERGDEEYKKEGQRE